MILLALFNDVTMITIAYDNVTPSATPDSPMISYLLTLSLTLGLVETAQTMLFRAYAPLALVGPFSDHLNYRMTIIYLQVSIAIESLIFNCREPDRWMWSSAPVWPLAASVLVANVTVSALCYVGFIVNPIKLQDIIVVWVYDLAWLLVIDAVKLGFARVYDGCLKDVLEPLERRPSGVHSRRGVVEDLLFYVNVDLLGDAASGWVRRAVCAAGGGR